MHAATIFIRGGIDVTTRSYATCRSRHRSTDRRHSDDTAERQIWATAWCGGPRRGRGGRITWSSVRERLRGRRHGHRGRHARLAEWRAVERATPPRPTRVVRRPWLLGRGRYRRRGRAAVSGGNDNTVNTVGASATTTSTTTSTPTTTTVAPAGGGTVPPTKASGQAPAGGSKNQPAPANTPPPATGSPTTTTTQPSVPKPVFTQASASPNPVRCPTTPFPPTVTVTVSYTATNSTNVYETRDGGPTGTGPGGTVSGSIEIDGCAPNAPTQMSLTATGPGGSTTTTVSWTVLSTS
jgi:hypothetical protein